jgi:metallo-beta-lactamase family protein
MITIEFFGAAKTVTGSNYLVKTDLGNFVVDCGMFQGEEVEHYNLEPITYDTKDVDFTLLTHAHIDHSGMLPKLVKAGFNGNIYATNHTIQITTELLLDSAKLQENAYQRGENYGKYTGVKAIVYNTKDAMQTINMFKVADYDTTFEPIPGIKVTYIVAGHILGAASIIVEVEDEGKTKKIVFSGDIGRIQSPLIPTFDLNFKYNADYVIMESLYGGQIHTDRHESTNKLVTIIKETVDNGGSAYIPCFAVQRAQEVLNDLKKAKASGALGNDLPVWLDSPLAQRVTGIYSKSLQYTEDSPFDFPNLIYVKKFKQSAGLAKQSKQVVLAGSGMADGGRIMNHLVTALTNKKNAIIFVGFQAEGTLGRELVEGAKKVVIGTKTVSVNAQIHQLEGFSAHGDTNDYTEWLKRFLNDNLSKVFLVHAEPDRAEALKSHFEKMNINNCYIPSLKEEVTL